ncbi:MAG: hypothetical protein LBB94_07320 [Clostridiales bacterium]|jgi:hypothetical protein|nr:hypothetical protein [Clostridiales bacterium]
MTKARGFVLDIINSLAVFALFFSLAVLPAAMTPRRPLTAYILILFIVPHAICLLLRRHLKRLSLFLLIHAAMPLSVLILDAGLYQRLTYLAFMLAIVIYSVVKRLKDTAPDVSASFVTANTVCALVLAIAAGRLNQPEAAYVQPFSAAVVFICYIVFQHMRNLDDTLELITKTTVQPIRAVLSMNNRIIASFAVIAAIAALLSGFVKLDRAVALLGSWIAAFLRFSLGFLDGRESVAETEALLETPAPPDDFSPFPIEPQKEWPFWAIFENVVRYVITGALIVAAAGLIIYLCVRLYRRFYETVKSDDEIEIIPHDTLAAEAMRAIKAFFIPVSGVRRRFYKKIRQYIKKGAPILPSDTPEEMTWKIIAEDISELTDAYQKERY